MGTAIFYKGTRYPTGSGGGSGGGSSVIPNPSGTPTDTLDTIEIDGDIYEIQGGGGSSVNYSTTEQVIGTYFGKPLYQKCFDGLSVNVNNGSWYNIVNIPNGKDLIDIKMWGEFSEYYMLIPCQAHIDSTNNGLLEVLFAGLNTTRTVKRLAVQYTKITD